MAGVMGWPVKHSRSPAIHGHWLERYGIDGAYVPFNVSPERVGDAVRALATLGFAGTNLTLPHKETVLPHLDDIDPVARRIGAVNTVTVREDGALLGSNTDAFGFLEHLRAEVPGWTPGVAAVLGAGGAARAVVAALVDAGAAEIRLANRTPERSERLAAEIGGPVIPVSWEHRCGSLEGADLLVNTTSLGMGGGPHSGSPWPGLARMPSSTISSMCLWRRNSLRRRVGPVWPRWTASACCCIRPVRDLPPGSDGNRRWT